MLCKVYCACCNGLEVTTVTIEVQVSDGVQFFIVGLPDSAIKESQQRIESALESYGYKIPGKRVVINMAPANIRKEGSAFDAAIAIGIAIASGQIKNSNLSDFYVLGELSLDGEMRPVPGALPIIIHAKEEGRKACILPLASAMEGAEIEGINVYGAHTLKDVINIIENPSGSSDKIVTAKEIENEESNSEEEDYDFANVKGQEVAKYGLEVAAAGAHNVLMIGSPGSGKTFMAKCLPGILPPMTKEESIETSQIYSVSGMLRGLMKKRPFRSPHHTITIAALVGGGNKGLPGEISLAHNGVLFCDEFAEFNRRAIEVLRQPVEDGIISISRVRGKYFYPARFMFVAAMNPCPCGHLFDEPGKCTCTTSSIERYRAKVSGPIYDRIDITLKIKKVRSSALVGVTAKEEPGKVVAERVRLARKIQNIRYLSDGESFYTNAAIPTSLLPRYCPLGDKERILLQKAISSLGITARGYSRILRIARTIADLNFVRYNLTNQRSSFIEAIRTNSLDTTIPINTGHIASAIGMRCPEKEEFS